MGNNTPMYFCTFRNETSVLPFQVGCLILHRICKMKDGGTFTVRNSKSISNSETKIDSLFHALTIYA